MDRDQLLEIGPDIDGRNPADDPDRLPSRRDAREAIRAAVVAGRGPVVLTGEPGVGKTFLLDSLEAEAGVGEAWTVVEVTPATGTGGLYRLIARGLGVDADRFGRVELLDLLAERSIDGERRTLAIDEAHNLDSVTLEEVRVLANRSGRPDGFAAILLVGQTSLALRLRGREAAGLRSRIAAHVHLQPLDADEVGLLLESLAPGRDWDVEDVERLHMTSRGKPARVVELAAQVGPPALSFKTETAWPRPLAAEPPGAGHDRDAPLVGPSKPPIRVEEGMIEVGWQPEAVEVGDDGLDDEESLRPTPSPEGEERINDHYAALQAWEEWARNQGRHPEIDGEAAPPVRDSPVASTPNVRAEDEHGHAPLGRLFSRLSQENETE